MGAPRSYASLAVLTAAALVLLTPLRRLVTAPGVPLWALFLLWALLVLGAAWAARDHEPPA